MTGNKPKRYSPESLKLIHALLGIWLDPWPFEKGDKVTVGDLEEVVPVALLATLLLIQ